MIRIIRASGSAAPRKPNPEATRVLRADQLRSLREADELLQSARQRAAALLEDAATEAAEVRCRAIQEGQAQAAVLLCRAEERVARTIEDAHQELTTLAIRIAERILGEQLRIHPDSVCAIVQQCLRACQNARRLRVRANPEDLPLLEAALPRLAAKADLFELNADLDVSRGGCVVESDLGEVDGRLEVQLARLAEGLR